MPSLETQFVDIQKRIRQELRSKMQSKMVRAARETMRHADDMRDYHDVTGNLYKSTAVGVYYKGTLTDVVTAPGPDPMRTTLAKGEHYNLERYYGGVAVRRAYKGEYGEGGEWGPRSAEDALLYSEHVNGRYDLTWQLKLVAGVDYAQYVDVKGGHDVISSLRGYMVRYWKKM